MAPTEGTIYAGKLVTATEGRVWYLAFRNTDAHGSFVGEITDPVPVSVDGDGRLSVG